MARAASVVRGRTAATAGQPSSRNAASERGLSCATVRNGAHPRCRTRTTRGLLLPPEGRHGEVPKARVDAARGALGVSGESQRAGTCRATAGSVTRRWSRWRHPGLSAPSDARRSEAGGASVLCTGFARSAGQRVVSTGRMRSTRWRHRERSTAFRYGSIVARFRGGRGSSGPRPPRRAGARSGAVDRYRRSREVSESATKRVGEGPSGLAETPARTVGRPQRWADVIALIMCRGAPAWTVGRRRARGRGLEAQRIRLRSGSARSERWLQARRRGTSGPSAPPVATREAALDPPSEGQVGSVATRGTRGASNAGRG